MPPQWKYYAPGLGSFLLAWFVLLVPSLAVFLVVTVLVTFGVLYSFVIYQIRSGQASDFETQFGDSNNPRFKDVTAFIVRRGKGYYP